MWPAAALLALVEIIIKAKDHLNDISDDNFSLIVVSVGAMLTVWLITRS